MIYKVPLENAYKHNIFILLLRSILLLDIFRRTLLDSNKQNKHKQFSSSLYVKDDI